LDLVLITWFIIISGEKLVVIDDNIETVPITGSNVFKLIWVKFIKYTMVIKYNANVPDKISK